MLLCFCSCEVHSNKDSDYQPASSVNIVIPPFPDIERDAINFSEIEYIPPKTDELISSAESLRTSIEEGNVEYEEILSKLSQIDAKLASYNSMLSLLAISSSANLNDYEIASEYTDLHLREAAIYKAIDELLASIAKSDFGYMFEEELFGEGFVEKYNNGSRYTANLTSLLEQEAALEAEFFTLSNSEKSIRGSEIFTELLKIRSKIATSQGYENYAEYAYYALGYDYTPTELNNLIKGIAEFAVPIRANLSQRAFMGYFKTHKAPKVAREKIINDMYSVFRDMDDDIADAYAYMLNCQLYSIEYTSPSRSNGAFTTYLDKENLPYLFASFYGTVNDYTVLGHEFGHFYDQLTNDGKSESLDIAELSAQALELLTLSHLRDKLNAAEYKYLYYNRMQSVLDGLILQGFYAKFESLAYALPYSEITEERLDQLVVEAAKEMHLSTKVFDDLSKIIVIQLIDTPFYVQSYCTSMMVALDVFFMECSNEGAGVSVYKSLIANNQEDTFKERLLNNGINSPFEKTNVKLMIDKIYYSIIGSHYYIENDENDTAA